VPLGESIEWQDNGAYGSVTAIRDGNDGGGRYCREFQHQIMVGNRPQSGYGVACRQPDGAWEIVS
jgi:surface antigen